jgi:hypothetical protein
MPGFDWTTMQFAKGKETAKARAGGTTAIPRLEFHLQLLMVLQACASNLLEKITGTYYATAFPVGTALLRLEYRFDQYREKRWEMK